MERKSPTGAPWRNFYGRLHGKGLRDSQKAYMEDLEEIGLEGIGWDENPDRNPLDLAAIFDGKPVWLEVGFGGGEHMVHQAVTNPEVGIVGAEPYINGVAMLLGKIRKAGAGNIRVHPGDARDLMDVLPEGSVAKAFLLYPDPWPKKRPAKRRLLCSALYDLVARSLRPEGAFHVATDVDWYFEDATRDLAGHPCFHMVEMRVESGIAIETNYSIKYERQGRRLHLARYHRNEAPHPAIAPPPSRPRWSASSAPSPEPAAEP